ncbi:MAG: hypothetical protein NTV94_10245 [Planctomycetota bacterium]|nr:hypothetical protein [Planctomycetota bacterium]
MISRFTRLTGTTLLSLSAAATCAHAQSSAFSCAFNDLVGDYAATTPTSGTLTLRASATSDINSRLEFSRLIDPVSTTRFSPGFVANTADPADFVIQLNIIRFDDTFATASGSLTMTDIYGNTAASPVEGYLAPGSGSIALNASLENYQFSFLPTNTSFFAGNQGRLYLDDTVCAQPLVGATTCLIQGESGFFTTSFSNKLSSGTLQLLGPLTRICLGDFNCDGGADGSDLEAFFTIWETGTPAADVNQDGGVDGGDIETFILAWEAGC